MVFVQFYQKSAISDEIIEACGDRSVIILDGRNSRENHLRIARQECKKRDFKGFALFKGESFCRATQITKIEIQE